MEGIEVTRENFEQIANKCIMGELFGRFITTRGCYLYSNDLYRHQALFNRYVFRGNYFGRGRGTWEFNEGGFSIGNQQPEVGDIVKFEPLNHYVIEFYDDPTRLLGGELMRTIGSLATKLIVNGKVIKSRYTYAD